MSELALRSNSTTPAFAFESISLRVRTPKGPRTVLRGISAAARAGDMIAILGPSGCGKSSLLDVLAANIGLVDSRSEGPASDTPVAHAANGRVLFKGAAISTVANYRKRVVYVMQDDVFVPVLTVRETLLFYAQLRLPDLDQAASRVEELLQAVRLDHVADTPVRWLYLLYIPKADLFIFFLFFFGCCCCCSNKL